jgi:hypothetical protein
MINILEFFGHNLDPKWAFGVFFSGIGVFIIERLYKHFRRKRLSRVPQRTDSASASVVQKGDGATTVQQGRTETGHVVNINAPVGASSLEIRDATWTQELFCHSVPPIRASRF